MMFCCYLLNYYVSFLSVANYLIFCSFAKDSDTKEVKSGSGPENFMDSNDETVGPTPKDIIQFSHHIMGKALLHGKGAAVAAYEVEGTRISLAR